MTKQCPTCSVRYEDTARFCQRDGTALQELTEESAVDPYVGQVLLGQFEVQEAIGEGGMGRVYRAHQRGFDRLVAIKILHEELVANEEIVKRFNREAKIVSHLDHPCIIHVYLFGELPDGNLFLAMEYVDGTCLSALLKTGPLPLPLSVHISAQILSALTEAHRKGVVHRDLKPDNIMLMDRPDEPASVKVLDFGIAKFLGARTVLTQQGLVFGSARYISPEAAAGEPVDERADLYAVGVILYQMLAGRPPFEDTSAVALLMRHVNDPPPPLLDQPAARSVPPGIARVVMRALEKDPARRFDGAAAMRAALLEEASAVGAVFPADLSPVGVRSVSAFPYRSPAPPGHRAGSMVASAPLPGGQTLAAARPISPSPAAGVKAWAEGPLMEERASSPSSAEGSSGGAWSGSLPATQPSRAVHAVSVSSASLHAPDDQEELPRLPGAPWGWIFLVIIAAALLGGVAWALWGGTAEEAPLTQLSTSSVRQSAPKPVPVSAPTEEGATNASLDAPSAPVNSNTAVVDEAETGAPHATPGAAAVVSRQTAAPRGRRTTPRRSARSAQAAEPAVMPPAATVSVVPRRPTAGQPLQLLAKVTPAHPLSSPYFVVAPEGGASVVQQLEAEMVSPGLYGSRVTLVDPGSYRVTFFATSRQGEVQAWGAVTAASPEPEEPAVPVQPVERPSGLRALPTEIASEGPASGGEDEDKPEEEPLPPPFPPSATPWNDSRSSATLVDGAARRDPPWTCCHR